MAARSSIVICLQLTNRIISLSSANYGRNLLQNGRRFLLRSGKRPILRAAGSLALAVPFVPTVHAFWGKKQAPTEVPAYSPIEKMIEEADDLYAENRVVELYGLLREKKDEPMAELQWRFGRAAYEMSKLTEKAEEKKAFLYESYESVQYALKLDENNFAAHKWFAILLDSVGEMEGTKQRITNAFKVKEHFMKSIELNPKDATSVHLLGYWCFLFADMPWYQRKIASVVFASPPSSSYQEALEYFQKAESIEPNFYSKNLMMIGKTYIRMGDKTKARDYLTRAVEYPVKTEDDKASHKEAEDLLKSL